jgi:hypothetical protein
MTDLEWHRLVKAGDEEGWKLVWERVIATEAKSLRSAELLKKYSITDGDLMGMLYEEMVGRGKIDLYRGEGSFEGWLRRYVRGYVLNAAPNKHGEISIEGAYPDADNGRTEMDIPVDATKDFLHNETWGMTHWCFRKLWNEDPERCYVHVLKTRFHLSSDEVRDFLDVSSSANVDQIFSRSVKFMRKTAGAVMRTLLAALGLGTLFGGLA